MRKTKIPEKNLRRKQLRILVVGAGHEGFSQSIEELKQRVEQMEFERGFVFSLKKSEFEAVAKTATAGLPYNTVRQVKTDGTVQDTVRHFLKMGAKHSTIIVDERLTDQTAELLKNGRGIHVVEHCTVLPDDLSGYDFVCVHKAEQSITQPVFLDLERRHGKQVALALLVAGRISQTEKRGVYVTIQTGRIWANPPEQEVAHHAVLNELGIKTDGEESKSETHHTEETSQPNNPPALDSAGDGEAGRREDVHDQAGDQSLREEVQSPGTDN